MEFIDLKTQYTQLKTEIDTRIAEVIAHGRFIMGPEVTELEEKLAAYVGSRHAIAVSSGTDALLLALMALKVRPGDEIITTPFTFIATGEMIALVGATAVFVDIDPHTYNIDPNCVEAAITSATRAIMPVSLFGQCADMDALNAIGERHNLPVIEDGAQSFGATYKGRKSCALSTIGCTSFFPSKPLGCYGDGGACFTDDDSLAELMRRLRIHGQERRYHHTSIGINGRMDTLQAAILLAKLTVYDDEIGARQRIAMSYIERLNALCPEITTPVVGHENSSVFAQFSVQADGRARYLGTLDEFGIPVAVHYPVPLHRQPVFAEGGRCRVVDTLEHSERVAERIFSLPMHPFLSAADQERVLTALVHAAEKSDATN